MPYCSPPNKDVNLSKTDHVGNAEEWNTYVDEYIESGLDRRPRRSIELVCKVSPGGAPMYRLCESGTCENREGHQYEFKHCGKCKLSVYCSPQCQTRGWKAHKRVCCADNQTPQWLIDSRIVHEEFVAVEGKRAAETLAELAPGLHDFRAMMAMMQQMSANT